MLCSACGRLSRSPADYRAMDRARREAVISMLLTGGPLPPPDLDDNPADGPLGASQTEDRAPEAPEGTP